jgi:hypothetical protein
MLERSCPEVIAITDMDSKDYSIIMVGTIISLVPVVLNTITRNLEFHLFINSSFS